MFSVRKRQTLKGLILVRELFTITSYCTSYTDRSGVSHRTQQCTMSYCCGDCAYKYCCKNQAQRLTQSQQERCSSRTGVNSNKTNRLGVLLGSILGSVFPIILCVGLIICCVAPCCLCYKKCRKGGNRSHTGRPQIWLKHLCISINYFQMKLDLWFYSAVIISSTVVQPPVQPHSPGGYQPGGYQPGYPGYQPVPGFGGPMPPAPPPYSKLFHDILKLHSFVIALL
uniref:Shisa N-terminal domain-containing protein n=1 Tax=Acanthochromis polyacanthus TaxID=80966 RepID=A0A3Q1FZJ2_9TELE